MAYDPDYVAELLETPTDFEPFKKLDKDLKKAALQLPRNQARFYVDYYYQLQQARIRCSSQLSEAQKAGEPTACLQYMYDTNATMEKTVQKMLGIWAKQWRVGAWLQSICGIGPVISACLLAHIDIRIAKTAGQIWRFAGLDPTVTWEKKTKRPWNGDLKVVCAYKLGESFVKVQNRDKDVYGKIFRQRKDQELALNAQGKFKNQAEKILDTKNFGKETKARAAYECGELPDAHIHARARRYAVKLFLSHLHEVMYRDYFDTAPPVPYPFADENGTHRHFIKPPIFDQKGRSLKEMYPPLPPVNER